jgi:hypothetical protein
MSEEKSASLVKLEDLLGLSKPCQVLIEKISQAVGGMFRPHQTVRIARADAEAAFIKANSDIQINDLSHRAMLRFIEEEKQYQLNMESITANAINDINLDAHPQDMDLDWISSFFQKARHVSDTTMQSLWSKILAGEANHPGSFSKRTLGIVSDIGRHEAETFTEFGRFCVHFKEANRWTPVVFDTSLLSSFFNFNIDSMRLLEALGLAQNLQSQGHTIAVQQLKPHLHYFGKIAELSMPRENEQIYVGRVSLTAYGEELMPICGAEVNPEFWDHVLENLNKYNPIELTGFNQNN